MGIVRDLYYARKMSAGLKLPAPTVALLIKRLRLAAAMGGGGIEKTVSGTMVHITDALAKAALSVLVNITPTQPGSGDPSPLNIRPISGLTGLSVYRRGKNLLNTATNITGKYISSNGGISNGDDAQYTDLIPVKAGETYVCSFVSGRDTGTNRWHAYNANGVWVKQLSYISASGQQGNKLVMAATIDSGISYVRLSYGINDTDAMISCIVDSIADKFYEGYLSSSKGRLISTTELQSPYTSTDSKRCPATMYRVIPGRFYTVVNNVPPATALVTGFYANVDDATDASKSVGGANTSLFSAPAGANYAVTIYIKQTSGTTYTFDKPMVSEVSTDYQPYGYNEYPCDWTTQAGTVYGGTLDVVTGELVVDRGRVNISSSWYWNKSGSYPGGFYAAIENAGTGQKTNTPFICSHANTATSISQYVQGTCFCDGSINIRIMDGSDTVQDWKNYINDQITAGTPIQICYELATPLTYQLTPQEVQMLLGENYVWSSSGDTVSVTYYAEGNANNRQALNILLGGNYSNPKTADDVSDKEALEIILGGNK